MTVLRLADEGEAADLAAFLARLIHYDRGAAVRLQAAGTTLAVFGRPPSFEVLAIRTARLAQPYENGDDVRLDVTVSAGELLEAADEPAATVIVPAAVTGPPWAGVLPPRGGWRPEPGLPAPEALRATVAAAVAEFRSRTQELTTKARTRAELDPDRAGHLVPARRRHGTAGAGRACGAVAAVPGAGRLCGGTTGAVLVGRVAAAAHPVRVDRRARDGTRGTRRQRALTPLSAVVQLAVLTMEAAAYVR